MAEISELLNLAKSQAGISNAPANPLGGMPNAQVIAGERDIEKRKKKVDMYNTLRDAGYDHKSAYQVSFAGNDISSDENVMSLKDREREANINYKDAYSKYLLNKAESDNAAKKNKKAEALMIIKNAPAVFGQDVNPADLLGFLAQNKYPIDDPEIMEALSSSEKYKQKTIDFSGLKSGFKNAAKSTLETLLSPYKMFMPK